jgi:16S rRNA (guanine527-N7)-methyltransferase
LLQSEKKSWFNDICLKNGLDPTTGQKNKLDQFANLLLEWNRKINLISRKDEENIWTYHILHSISPLLKIEIPNGCTMIDIGTGGGLPGLPIKILRPDISMLCLDSTSKKVKAVKQIVDDLDLQDIKIVWGRAEEISLQSEYKGKFDFALARAVAPLSDLVLWSRSFLGNKTLEKKTERQNVGSRIDANPPVLLAFKGGDITKEIEIAIKKHAELEIKSIDLTIIGAEEFITSDKKLLVVHL